MYLGNFLQIIIAKVQLLIAKTKERLGDQSLDFDLLDSDEELTEMMGRRSRR